MILVSDPAQTHADYKPNRIPYSKKLKLHCATNDIKLAAESIVVFACPRCEFEAAKMNALRTHVQQEHKLDMCTTCMRRRKVFPREQRLYDEKGLRAHKKRGDPPTGDEAAIPPHVRCGLCNEWFLDEDDLYLHQPQAHVKCQVCRRQGKDEWLKDDRKLLEHYREEHIVCTEPDCTLDGLENVFINEIDFQAHILKAHSSGRDRRQARLVNLDIRYQSGRSESGPPTSSVSTGTSHSRADASESKNEGDEFPALNGREPQQAVSWSFHGDAAAQNRQLMAALRATLGDEGLRQFRAMSASYRDGECSAEEYYRHFCELFVGTSAPVSMIWMNLVGLLPDFNKRTELYEVHHKAVREGRRFDALQSSNGGADAGQKEEAAEPPQPARSGQRRQRERTRNARRGRGEGAQSADAEQKLDDDSVAALTDRLQNLRLDDVCQAFQTWAAALALLLTKKSAGVTLQPEDLRLSEADEQALQAATQKANLGEMVQMAFLHRLGFNPAKRTAIAEKVRAALSNDATNKDCLKEDAALQSLLEECSPRELFLLRKYARAAATARPDPPPVAAQAPPAEAAAALAATQQSEEHASGQSEASGRKKTKRKEKQLLMKIGL